MYCTVKSLGLTGIDPYIVSVEVDLARGLPGFEIVGLPDAAVKESRDRVRAALQNMGYKLPQARIVANLAPADTKKQGSVYDLPLLLALLHAAGLETLGFDGIGVVGEIGLTGEIRGIPGVLPMVLEAGRLELSRVIVPLQNAGEAAVVQDVEVLCAQHVQQVVDYLSGKGTLTPANQLPSLPSPKPELPDFVDVKGQREAKRALEIAAAGGHNVLLLGSPGAGKSMLARRLPSILPPLSHQEAIQVTKLYSVAGMLEPGTSLLEHRPFRSPHHTVSPAALTGGGPNAKPGEISLAHNGVLFLDELPEFQKNALEVLRQPLESGEISIARVRQRLTYPSKVMLIAAMNPCPCGFFGHPTRLCTCTPQSVRRYVGRVSGPLLDRVDIHVEVLPVSYQQISGKQPGETSAQIRKRVLAARQLQSERYQGTSITCNAMIPSGMLAQVCQMEPQAETLLEVAFERMGLSARGYDRILKVARTIADLDSAQRIGAAHISQAVQLRGLDRKYFSASQ